MTEQRNIQQRLQQQMVYHAGFWTQHPRPAARNGSIEKTATSDYGKNFFTLVDFLLSSELLFFCVEKAFFNNYLFLDFEIYSWVHFHAGCS